MANDNQIVIELVAEVGTLKKQVEELKKDGAKQGKEIGENISSGITAGFGKLAAVATAIGGTLVAALGIREAVHEAIAAEKALNLLNQSLANSGKFSKAASEQFVEFAKGLQAVTSFSDDVIISNASILASLGNLSGQGLERATKAALDFAATGRIGLEGAFDAIAKAAAGNVASLSRYGIKVDESLTKSEKFEQALTKLEAKFGGLAEAQGATFGGTLDRIKNQFNDISEAIGNLVIKSPVVVALFKAFSDFLGNLGGKIEAFGKSGDVLGDLIKKLIDFGLVLVRNVLPPIELFGNIAVVAFNAAKTAVQGFVVAITFIPSLLGEIVGKVLQFASGIGSIVGVFNEELGNKITNGLQKAGQSLTDFSTNVRTTATETLTDFANQTGDAVGNIFNFDKTAQVDAFLVKIQDIAAQAQPLGDAIKNGIGGGFTEASDAAKRAADAINKAYQQGIVNTISVAAQAIGSSLVKGGKAFDNFKNQVLNIIGDMAIQIGTTLVGIGIGIDAIKLSLTTLSGGTAIAAGLALIAIGGLLKSLSTGGGEGSGVAAGSVGGGGSNVGGGEFAAISPDQDATRAKGTVVNVNVAGNVLDRRESALEISKIIQEQFDVNGQVIAQGGVA